MRSLRGTTSDEAKREGSIDSRRGNGSRDVIALARRQRRRWQHTHIHTQPEKKKKKHAKIAVQPKIQLCYLLYSDVNFLPQQT